MVFLTAENIWQGKHINDESHDNTRLFFVTDQKQKIIYNKWDVNQVNWQRS